MGFSCVRHDFSRCTHDPLRENVNSDGLYILHQDVKNIRVVGLGVDTFITFIIAVPIAISWYGRRHSSRSSRWWPSLNGLSWVIDNLTYCGGRFRWIFNVYGHCYNVRGTVVGLVTTGLTVIGVLVSEGRGLSIYTRCHLIFCWRLPLNLKACLREAEQNMLPAQVETSRRQ